MNIHERLELEARRFSDKLQLIESIPPRPVQLIQIPAAIILHRFNALTGRAGLIYCSLGPNDVIDASFYDYVGHQTSNMDT